MRHALLIAAVLAAPLAALPAAAARADGDGPVAAAQDRDDAFAQAVEAPPPRTVVVTARRPAPSPRDKLIVASTAPDRVFEEDEEGARIDDFINGPIQPGRPGEGEPRPCDPHPPWRGRRRVRRRQPRLRRRRLRHGGPAGGALPWAGGALGLGRALQRRPPLLTATRAANGRPARFPMRKTMP